MSDFISNMLYLCQQLGSSWDKYCYYLLHSENSIDIRDPFETKLQLYIDDNELQNMITIHFVLALKAISADVMFAVYKLHEFLFANFFGT